MKKIIGVILLLGLFSCEEKVVPKPNQLLSEEVMVDILYDTALLQAAEAYLPDELTLNNIRIKSYIYNKYKIDSITYYQNQRYYASNIRKYRDMHSKVLKKLELKSIETDSLLKKEEKTSKELPPK